MDSGLWTLDSGKRLSKYHDKDVLIATLVQSCTGKRPSFCDCLPFNTAIIKKKIGSRSRN